MGTDAWITVADFLFCTSEDTMTTDQRPLRLFSALKPLLFLEMDTVGLLPISKSDNQHVVVLTDWNTNLKMAIFVNNVTLLSAATVLVANWVMAYFKWCTEKLTVELRTTICLENFWSLGRTLDIRHMTIMAYGFQASRQRGWPHKTIIQGPRKYAAEHEMDWNTYMQLLTYAYRWQVSWSMGATPINPVQSDYPPCRTAAYNASTIPNDMIESPHKQNSCNQYFSRWMSWASKWTQELRLSRSVTSTISK